MEQDGLVIKNEMEKKYIYMGSLEMVYIEPAARFLSFTL